MSLVERSNKKPPYRMSERSTCSAVSTTVPSLHDGMELECRIYHPRRLPTNRVAIFAHPYGPLGGSFDDAAVLLAASELSAQGYIVGTFNFRGAGASGGRTSWTAKPEIQDYRSLIGFMLAYAGFSLANIDAAGSADDEPSQSIRPSHKVIFLCGGYSYGAMITAQVHSPQQILEAFAATPAGSPEAKIVLRAQSTVLDSISSSRGQARGDITGSGGSKSPGDAHRPCVMPQLTLLRAFYLLVSPVLPPASWAIALPVRSSPTRRAGTGAQDEAREAETTDKLHQQPTCVIYGQFDQFTAAGKLRKWAVKLQSAAGSQVTISEIAGIGHFWVSDAASNRLREAIRTWLLGLG